MSNPSDMSDPLTEISVALYRIEGLQKLSGRCPNTFEMCPKGFHKVSERFPKASDMFATWVQKLSNMYSKTFQKVSKRFAIGLQQVSMEPAHSMGWLRQHNDGRFTT